ncbi:hypothetical protein B0T22DRAFT_437449 [Podospora appendiculata]|uniref:Uncharacterized protein n=1 Tax=Podospora appendiculata TaxID=314037 RepID=A0AAE0XJF1_9PEZI|nr:hypothetical protein B0T22DRAFT_437449 [Podospora appendiculata]
MVALKQSLVGLAAACVIAGPLPPASPVDMSASTHDSDTPKQAECGNWLPTVISGLADGLVTIGICAPEPTGLSQVPGPDQGLHLNADVDVPTSTSSAATVTVTVTSTATASAASSPAPVSDVTVQRTFTVSAWTKTQTLNQPVNCTRTILAPAPTTTAAPSTTAVPLLPRSEGSNSTTTVGRPGRTRTSWIVTTATQTGDLVYTRYECTATVAYQFIVDGTTTLPYTVTKYPSTVTAGVTIPCYPFGYGVPSGTSRLPPPPAPTSTATSTAPPKFKVAPKRQGSSSTGSGSSSAVATPSTSPASVAVPATPTIVVHLTRTQYTAVTITATTPGTAYTYACSPTTSAAAPPATPSASATPPVTTPSVKTA